MTQAVNLANFANNLDSSGGLNPSGLNAPVPISKGGTAAATSADARTNLGLVIGTNVPSPTGTGASGTWPISISGNAATATSATSATSASTATYATTAGNGGVTSVDSTTGAITLANLAAFSRSFGGNGYQKLPGGLIIQWGILYAGIGYTYQSFPITFPNAVLSIVTSYAGRGAAGDYRAINGFWNYGAEFGTDNCYAFWIAVGY